MDTRPPFLGIVNVKIKVPFCGNLSANYKVLSCGYYQMKRLGFSQDSLTSKCLSTDIFPAVLDIDAVGRNMAETTAREVEYRGICLVVWK